eukprot:TRINITY_DN1985_c1_g1_i3.p1 TRINITY_DN1985_c1_g1~~TRINITY_DN1985_c1_g1_i3.p1  ORF type:complete len:156 (+),score=28.83 TRINITY_DN1985_c1_g1_i3:226-693(+)
MSFLTDSKSIDRQKCTKLSLVHNIVELIVCDIIPHDGVSNEEKHELEKVKIKEDLEGSPIEQEFYDLWLEYEESSTPESKVVHELGKLEIILEAYENGKENPKIELDQFFSSCKDMFKAPFIKELTDIVSNRREEYLDIMLNTNDPLISHTFVER